MDAAGANGNGDVTLHGVDISRHEQIVAQMERCVDVMWNSTFPPWWWPRWFKAWRRWRQLRRELRRR